MAKQSQSRSKSKNAEKIGKGKVTPVQVAFIVDRYLLDNNFTKTRTIFRSEALNLLSKSPVQEAPKSLLSLGVMLDEYISLKEQKVSLEQERYRMGQDKLRVDNLLKGLQDAMNGFNATAHLVTPQPVMHPSQPPPPPPHSINSGITSSNCKNDHLPIGSSPGYYSVYGSPAVISSYSGVDANSVPSQITNHTVHKRKASANPSDACHIARKSRRSSTSTNQLLSKGSEAHLQPSNGYNQVILRSEGTSSGSKVYESNPVQTSNVVKCLFTKPDKSSPHNSSDPKTPPLQSSSDAERTASPVAMCSTAGSSKDVTPRQITSTNCTIISSETIRVSPEKQISYYSIARNQHITASPVKAQLKKPNRRDHVKGRLDFDAPEMLTGSETPATNEISASGCTKEIDDILDLDFPNLDILGSLNLSELLSDFDLADEGTSCSSQPSGDSSPDSSSRSPQQSVEVNIGANQVYSQLSSTVTEIISEKDMTSSGSDPITTVKSITKTIKIISPAKSQRRSPNHEQVQAQDKLD